MSRGAVLLVEDSIDVRNVISEIISGFGYSVSPAADGIDAWKMIRSDNFDLVITDIGLPNMAGDELIRKMRRNNINIPVILIAGVDIKKGSAYCDRLINCRFVQKPFAIDELRSSIVASLPAEIILTRNRKGQ